MSKKPERQWFLDDTLPRLIRCDVHIVGCCKQKKKPKTADRYGFRHGPKMSPRKLYQSPLFKTRLRLIDAINKYKKPTAKVFIFSAYYGLLDLELDLVSYYERTWRRGMCTADRRLRVSKSHQAVKKLVEGDCCQGRLIALHMGEDYYVELHKALRCNGAETMLPTESYGIGQQLGVYKSASQSMEHANRELEQRNLGVEDEQDSASED